MARTVFKELAQNPVTADGRIVFRASNSDPDRIGDVVVAEGIDLSRWAQNPVVLWNHDPSIPAIGTGNAYVQEGALFLEPSFSETNPLGLQIAAQVKAGELRAVSIGFIPLESKPNEHGGTTYTRAELTEISIVNVPCNPGALRVKALKNMDPEKIAEKLAAAKAAIAELEALIAPAPEAEEPAETKEAPSETSADAPEAEAEQPEDELQKFFASFYAVNKK